MDVLFFALGATLAESIISFSGAALIIFGEEKMKRLAHFTVSFAVGALLSVSLFELIPEALATSGKTFESLAIFIFSGIFLFFILEKFFIWYHHHGEDTEVHSYTHLILWGDFLHNAIDGVIIGLAFLTDVRLGFLTTAAIIFHEIPQEISDFGVLIHGGLDKKKALLYNFLISLSTIFGVLLTFALGDLLRPFLPYALLVAAGNFMYIAVADLMPELHESSSMRHGISQIVFIILGAIIVIVPGFFFE